MKKKHYIILGVVAVLVVLFVVLALTNPSEESMKGAVSDSFYEQIKEAEETLNRTITPTYVYKNGLILSSYTETCKISSLTAIRETYLGIAGRIIKVDGNGFGEFIVNCTKWLGTLFQGALITISITILSVLAGLVIAVLLALGKMSKIRVLKKICDIYIFFFRGTPLLMQLFFIYYGLPVINPALAINSRFMAAWIAFSLNSGAYCAEIIRAGIQSIDKGQFEAAKALGFTYGRTMRKIIIPQTYRRLIPPYANEFIMVLKDASLTSVIALQDLSKVTQSILTSTNDVLVFIPSMAIYLLITWAFTKLFERLEDKFSIYE